MEEYKKFVEELKVFCLSKGFEIAGTCWSKSIYGEITVSKIGSDSGWDYWDDNKFVFIDSKGTTL